MSKFRYPTECRTPKQRAAYRWYYEAMDKFLARLDAPKSPLTQMQRNLVCRKVLDLTDDLLWRMFREEVEEGYPDMPCRSREAFKNRHSPFQVGSLSVCEFCGTQLGWFCPKSPDHLCHYYSRHDGRTVELITGKTFKLKKKAPREYQSRDVCLFCGEPDERK